MYIAFISLRIEALSLHVITAVSCLLEMFFVSRSKHNILHFCKVTVFY